MKNEPIICACHSAEHQWLIRRGDDDEEIYIHAHLVKGSLWYRIKYAVKYIFGYKCRYGAWDEIILTHDHAAQFKRLADELKIKKL